MRKKSIDKNFLLDKMSIVRYDLYFKFGEEYKRIVNAYHTAFAEAQSDPDRSSNWPATFAMFCEKMNTAMDNWKMYGYKREIEATFAEQRCYPAVLNNVIPTPAKIPASAA